MIKDFLISGKINKSKNIQMREWNIKKTKTNLIIITNIIAEKEISIQILFALKVNSILIGYVKGQALM